MESDPFNYFDKSRLTRLENLKESNHKAYPHTFSRDTSIKKIVTGEYDEENIRVAGVVVSKDIETRIIKIREKYDGPQIKIKLPEDEEMIPLEYVESGDLIGTNGRVATSSCNRGIIAEEFVMLAKSLVPPTTNQEEARYPEALRYQSVAKKIKLRSDIIKQIRTLLWRRLLVS